MLLLLLGLGIPFFSPTSTIFTRPDYTLIACIGLALVLAAFGTRGEVKLRGVYVTGAGAIAMVLFLILNPQRGRELKSIFVGDSASSYANSVLQGYLQGNFDNDDLRAIVMTARNNIIYGSFDFFGQKIERYEFEIKNSHIRSAYGDCIALNVFTKSNPKRFYIPTTYIATFEDVNDRNSSLNWKHQNAVWWQYDGTNILSDKGTPVAAQSCNLAAPVDKPISLAPNKKAHAVDGFLIGTAVAAPASTDNLSQNLSSIPLPITKS